MNPLRTPVEFDLSCAAAQEAIRIVKRLNDAGFCAYFAGGCVRDALLGKLPKDYDVATNATPDSIREVFGRRNTLAFGASFGVIGVLPTKKLDLPSGQKIEPTEVATFRSDGDYSDGRRPDHVHFGNAEADVLRRDFTINGLFYDPVSRVVIDYVDGGRDLDRGILRTIGDPVMRFAEDKLRMLRAVRFATTLGFEIEPATASAVREHASGIVLVSGERIGAEMRRTLSSANVSAGLDVLSDLELDSVVMPEFAEMDRGRIEGLFDDRIPRPFVVALGNLLLATDGVSDRSPAEHLHTIRDRWKLSGEEARGIDAIIKYTNIVIEADTHTWSTVQPILVGRDATLIVQAARQWATATQRSLTGVEQAVQALLWPAEKLNPPPLLGGHDLAAMGIEPGPAYAKLLAEIRAKQLDAELHSPQDAIEYVKSL